MKDLISVIVPIYNVEEVLPRCIDSIIGQTYKNLEIILVDDGSPDNSGKICDEYAKKDSRIKVLHKNNGGLSDARNKGLEIAAGKYIAFVDSDDYIHPRMYEILLENLKNNNADMSMCMYEMVAKLEPKKYDDIDKQSIVCYSKDECFNNLFNHLYLITELAWNKIYKKELWKNIRYPKGKIHEDEFVIHHLIDKCKKIVYTDSKLYYYYNRVGSITKNFTEKRLMGIEAFYDRMNFFKNKKDVELYIKSTISYLKIIAICYTNAIDNKANDDIVRKIKNKFFNEYSSIKKKISIPFKIKLQLLIAIHTPRIYLFLKKLIRCAKK